MAEFAMAKDVTGQWLRGHVVGERSLVGVRQLLFHFHGWNAKFDEWFDEGSDKLASASSPKNNFHDWGDAPNHIEADDFVASKILKKRVRSGEDQYLVEWETPDYDDRT